MSVWAENLDGAQAVKYDCEVGVFAWFGNSTLKLFCYDTGEELDIRTDYNIVDHRTAILAIDGWMNDLYNKYCEDRDFGPDDYYDDGQALASSGFGTDEDYGG